MAHEHSAQENQPVRRDDERPCVLVAGGDGGYGNLGDELLLEAARRFYRPWLDRFDVVVVMARPHTGRADGFVYVSPDGLESGAAVDPARVVLAHYYGGGYFNRYWYDGLIGLLRFARAAGLPDSRIAFTGQGLGPLEDVQRDELTSVAKGALVFGTRDRTHVLGAATYLSFDDSIRLYRPQMTVRRARPSTHAVAVNLRDEPYVGLDERMMLTILATLDQYLAERGDEGLAFGVVCHPEFDETTTLAGALQRAGVRGISVTSRPADFDALATLLESCAVTVTTSYHVALVSLYLGVPVVALWATEYYRLKFEGLAEVMDDPHLDVCPVHEFTAARLAAVQTACTGEWRANRLRARLLALREHSEAAHAPIAAVLSATAGDS